ncbi:MAG: hypothetical protein IJN91_04195, partial [Alphaproteobacteria bacterium]|nr:hypothetical protein [Alphaproteobacteria bacterium]
PCTGDKIKDNGVDKRIGVGAVYKCYISQPHCTGNKIKDNDIDMRNADNAVYKRYISCRPPLALGIKLKIMV